MYKIRIWKPVVGLVIAMMMVTAGGVALASHGFSDVPDSNPFHDDIDFIQDRGVTLGCGGGNYCPDDFVTREQMAAFMKRLASVLTPAVVTRTDALPQGNSVGQCATEAWTPFHEQMVVLSGGAYSIGVSGTEVNHVTAEVRYRANGGSWLPVTGSTQLQDGSPAAGGQKMTAPAAGALALTPGVAYEFALTVFSSGKFGACQLVAVFTNRMPGQGVGAS